MSVVYIGNNKDFLKKLDLHTLTIGMAVSTGRFRSRDLTNRKKYPLTAALLDLYKFPYSKKYRVFHHRACLSATKRGVILDIIDVEQPQE